MFPEYYFGQIFEARHEPGTIAYSPHLQMELLQETTDEMARNGCKKILIVNGHGGNEHLLPCFAQTQLAAPHDYVVYVFGLPHHPPGRPEREGHVDMPRRRIGNVARHDLAARSGASGSRRFRSRAPTGSACDLPEVYTQASGGMRDSRIITPATAALANRELGEFDMNAWAARSPARFAR